MSPFTDFFQRFGQQVSGGFQRFGQQARRDFESVGNFIKDKALPVIENVAGEVGRGIMKYGVPIAAAIAPELLPLVAGAGAIASRVGSAAGTGQKLIKTAQRLTS